MQLKVDKRRQVILLIPENPTEQATLNRLSKAMSPGNLIHFNGSKNLEPKTLVVYLCHRGVPLNRSESFESKGIYKYGDLIELSANTPKTRKNLQLVADICQLNTLGLIYLRTEHLENQTCLVFTGKICTLCESPIITDCNHLKSICKTCAKNCSHVYLPGHLIQRQTPFDTIPILFCQHCGRSSEAISQIRQKRSKKAKVYT